MSSGRYPGGNGHRNGGQGRNWKGKTPLYRMPGSTEWVTAADYSGITIPFTQSLGFQTGAAYQSQGTYHTYDSPIREQVFLVHGIEVAQIRQVYEPEDEILLPNSPASRAANEAIEDAAFYRDIRALDNYNAAASGTSHVLVIPGQTRNEYYPAFPELSRQMEWPFGCPLPRQLAALLGNNQLAPVYQYQLEPVYPNAIQMGVPVSNGFSCVDRPNLVSLYEYFRLQPPPARPTQPIQPTLPTVQEEAEELENSSGRRISIPRSSSLQDVRNGWRGDPVVEWRATRSEGHGTHLD